MIKRTLIPLLLALLPYFAAAQEEVIVDRVAAVVGQNVIKLSDIENSYTQIRMRQGAGNAQENRCRILENILLTKLMVHKGMVDSIEVADEDVEQQVQYYLKSFMRQYGGKEELPFFSSTSPSKRCCSSASRCFCFCSSVSPCFAIVVRGFWL